MIKFFFLIIQQKIKIQIPFNKGEKFLSSYEKVFCYCKMTFTN